jgi:hypothetical protein
MVAWWGEWAYGRHGERAKGVGTVNGRAKNSPRPGFGSFATPAAPVLSRGAGCDTAQENQNGPQFLTKVHDRGPKTTAQNRRGIAQPATTPSALRVFWPYRSWFQRHRIAASPNALNSRIRTSRSSSLPRQLHQRRIHLLVEPNARD